MTDLFGGGRVGAPLPPDVALARSEARLARLQALLDAPWLTEERRQVIRNLTIAQARIANGRRRHLNRLN